MSGIKAGRAVGIERLVGQGCERREGGFTLLEGPLRMIGLHCGREVDGMMGNA